MAIAESGKFGSRERLDAALEAEGAFNRILGKKTYEPDPKKPTKKKGKK